MTLGSMGLSNSPTCRKCGTEEKISVNILGECEVLASLRHRYTRMGSSFLDLEDIRMLEVGAIWNFAKGTGFLLVHKMGHKGPVLTLWCRNFLLNFSTSYI